MRAISAAIATVFTEEGFATSDLQERLNEQGDLFRVDLADLTPEGFEFSGMSFQQWLRNQDRWTTERTQPKLQQALRRQVEKFRSNHE